MGVMKRAVSAAGTCRVNGWHVGTRLVGDEGYGPTIIRITAIGDWEILAVTESRNGQPEDRPYEGLWKLDHREWVEAS
jgi:hypothetical protein